MNHTNLITADSLSLLKSHVRRAVDCGHMLWIQTHISMVNNKPSVRLTFSTEASLWGRDVVSLDGQEYIDCFAAIARQSVALDSTLEMLSEAIEEEFDSQQEQREWDARMNSDTPHILAPVEYYTERG